MHQRNSKVEQFLVNADNLVIDLAISSLNIHQAKYNLYAFRVRYSNNAFL